MQIDWLTVAAQIVNFLLLVWLLQRFLYRPITNAMRRREERIEQRLAEVRAARQDIEIEAERLKQEQAALHRREDEILETARQDADQLRARLEADIREEMEDKRQLWYDHLAEERDAFLALLRRKSGQKVLEISRKIIADYADSDLSERVIATFAQRLKSIDPDTRDRLRTAAADEGAVATVFSGVTMDSASKGRITRAIHDIVSSNLEVRYQDDPNIVLGVRLTIGDYSAEWSAERYLKRLETELQEIIDAGSRSRGRAVDLAPESGRETV